MVTIKLTDMPLHELKTRSIALFVPQDEQFSSAVQHLVKEFFPSIDLEAYIKEQAFYGATGAVLSLPVMRGDHLKTLFLVGLGKKEKETPRAIEHLRRAIGSLVKQLQARRLTSCAFHLPEASYFKVGNQYLGRQVALTAQLAAYKFDDYITDPSRQVVKGMVLDWVVNSEDMGDLLKGIANGDIIAGATNRVRHWIDLPPLVLTPTDLSKKAQSIAQEYDLKYTVFDEPDINKMGMGGLSAVSAGSHQDCKLVIMEYDCGKKNAPTIALVGKGITFDSGGLSIKPAQHMETMKEDMSGAAAVIGTMQAIAQLKPHVNVIGVTPLSENLPSGTAIKPGDIVRFYNGKTAEIRNTDAEGRLILADALSYAVKHYKLDAMIDIATLTGACAAALGPYYTGMMGFHDEVMKQLEHAADLSGEKVWRLPFDADYKKSIVSDVADLCNIGKPTYAAGAITAGLFLSNFVDDVPWVHLDIAGTAFEVPDLSYYSHGATGVGVRLFVELLMNWQ
ncbi:MAG: leucyl aminopeptidase [Candidatus Babeliales bacterium]